MGMDVIGTRPAGKQGEYFRASMWSWRVIHCLISEANQRFALGLDLTGFDMNDGNGLSDQPACDRLAAALEHLVAENSGDEFTLDIEPKGIEGAVEAQLAAAGWQLTRSGSPYRATVDHVEDFIDFLKTCGGFRIH